MLSRIDSGQTTAVRSPFSLAVARAAVLVVLAVVVAMTTGNRMSVLDDGSCADHRSSQHQDDCDQAERTRRHGLFITIGLLGSAGITLGVGVGVAFLGRPLRDDNGPT